MLRTGGRAPERMATPKGLLDALNRKLAGTSPAIPVVVAPTPVSVAAKAPAPAARPTSAPKIAAPRLPASPAHHQAPVPPKPKAPAAPLSGTRGAFIVQVAALSSEASARSLSGRLGGRVSPAGRLWRVRMGPFTTRGEAEAALAKAKRASYSDARIQRAD